MKKLLLFLGLLAGCHTPRQEMPPLPEARPRLAARAALSPALIVPSAPSWHFSNAVYACRIEASTNLMDWWALTTVYHVHSLSIISDTVAKYPYLFLRLTFYP